MDIVIPGFNIRWECGWEASVTDVATTSPGYDLTRPTMWALQMPIPAATPFPQDLPPTYKVVWSIVDAVDEEQVLHSWDDHGDGQTHELGDLPELNFRILVQFDGYQWHQELEFRNGSQLVSGLTATVPV